MSEPVVVVADVARLLEWDTELFGMRVARLVPKTVSPAVLTDLLAWMTTENVACTYCLIDASDAEATRALEDVGARFVDVRMTLDLELQVRQPRTAAARAVSRSGARARLRLPACVRLATLKDLPVLERLAEAAHTDSRFYADGRFPRPRVDELYRTWIRKSIEGSLADGVMTFEDDEGTPAGYVTYAINAEGVGELGLVAIDARARGKGAASMLIDAALTALEARNVARAQVVTQGRNIAAQRIYQSVGFRTMKTELWFHVWVDRATTRMQTKGGQP